MNYQECVNEIKQALSQIELPYDSYTVFKKRKQSDKSIKKAIIDFTLGYVDKLEEIQEINLQAQNLSFWTDVDDIKLQLTELIKFINEANYEGIKFFHSSKSAKEIFDILVKSELAILDITKEIEINFTSFKGAFDNELLTNSKRIIDEVSNLLKQIKILWEIRMEAILNF